MRGRTFRKEIVEIGECVCYLTPGYKGRHTWEERWGVGNWSGVRDDSAEAIILTELGAIRANRIRRRSSDAARWNIEMFEKD